MTGEQCWSRGSASVIQGIVLRGGTQGILEEMRTGAKDEFLEVVGWTWEMLSSHLQGRDEK